jgi:hypothetical protein
MLNREAILGLLQQLDKMMNEIYGSVNSDESREGGALDMLLTTPNINGG